MYTRLIILVIFLAVVCLVNIIIYRRTVSLHKKYDDILDEDAKDVLEAKKYPNGEYEEAVVILSKMQSERKKAFKNSYLSNCMGYLMKLFYDRQKSG